jgi:intein/homing endonuclease
MDNPHVLVDEKELAYLAGILDGEGCISISKSTWRGSHHSFAPRVRVANSNLNIINHIADTMRKLGIEPYLSFCKRCEDNPKWKRVYELGLQNQTKCQKLLSVIKDYLVGKREQAYLVLEFAESRMSHPVRKKTYTKRELEIVQLLTNLNQRGTSQTVDYELAEMIANAS